MHAGPLSNYDGLQGHLSLLRIKVATVFCVCVSMKNPVGGFLIKVLFFLFLYRFSM